MVSSTPRPHFTPGKDPVPIVQEARWAPGPVWTGGKSRPHRDSIPDRPARSQSLYRLSYPAHTHTYIHTHAHTHTHGCILYGSQNKDLLFFYVMLIDLFLVAMAKLRKTTISFVLSVRPSLSVAWNSLAQTGRIFMKFDI